MLQLADNIGSLLVWIVAFLFVIGWFMKKEPGWYFWTKIGSLLTLNAIYAVLAYGGKCSWWLVAIVFFIAATDVIKRLPATDKPKEEKDAGT